jgi:hypothetical protein
LAGTANQQGGHFGGRILDSKRISHDIEVIELRYAG